MRWIRVCFVSAVALGACSSSTSPSATLQLVDGTGSSLARGSLMYSGSAKTNPTGGGVVLNLTIKNIGTVDTMLTVDPCAVQVRLYTTQTGGTIAYTPLSALPCAGAPMTFQLNPTQQGALSFVLYNDQVAGKIAPNTYYARLVPPSAPDAEISAGVIRR